LTTAVNVPLWRHIPMEVTRPMMRLFAQPLAFAGLVLVCMVSVAQTTPKNSATASNAALIAAGYLPPSIKTAPGVAGQVKVTFTYAPGDPTIVRVYLAGTFNNWKENTIQMNKSGNVFQRTIDLPVGVHEYKFVTVNSGGVVVWKEDPLNRLNTDDRNGGRNSLLFLQPVGGGGGGSAAGGGSVYANRGEPIRWEINVAAAQAQAVRERKGVIVFFSSSSATASRYIEDNIFTDGRVRDLVKEKFVPLRIDMQLQADLARRMGVPRGGVVAIYDVGGTRVLGVVDRPDSPETLLNKINEFISNAAAGNKPPPLPDYGGYQPAPQTGARPQ
jgi:hypothetical protein